MEKPIHSACETCAHFNAEGLKKLGVNTDNFDFVVALSGNPNTGKSTVFNALTGLRQHTGNHWRYTAGQAQSPGPARRQPLRQGRIIQPDGLGQGPDGPGHHRTCGENR